MRTLIRRWGILLWIAAMLLSNGCLAESMHQSIENPDLQVQVQLGYDGKMTYGKTMPIFVRVENLGEDLQATVAVNAYHSVRDYNRYEVELELAQDEVKELMIPIATDIRQDVFTVEIVRDGEILCAVNAAPDQTVNPNAMLVGVLSTKPENLSYMDISSETDELMRGEYIQTIALDAKTFPQTLELLNSFGAIVVDDVDVSAFSQSQQDALREWLEGGHILLIGGGAQAETTYPYFSDLTNLALEESILHEDISQALLSSLGIASEGMDRQILIARCEGGNELICDGETPLVWKNRVGSGVIYTAAFELGSSPVSTWAAMHTFWQQLWLSDESMLYQNGFSAGNDSYDSGTYILSNIPIKNTSNATALLVGLSISMLLCGLMAYCILKRVDRRQFLWVVLPMIALLCGIALMAVMRDCEMNQPIVLSVSSLIQDADGNRTLSNEISVATPERGEHLITTQSGKMIPLSDDYYFYSYEDGGALDEEPTTLNVRYVSGSQNGVGVKFDSAWSKQNLRIEDLPVPECDLETAIWREEDGMHGYVVNRSSMSLSQGVILSRYGYATVPDLAPGEQFEFELRSAVFADSSCPIYEDGCMYESLADGYADIYSIVYESLFRASQYPEGQYPNPTQEEYARCSLIQEAVGSYYTAENRYFDAGFYYVAFSDEILSTQVLIDGEPIERCEGLSVVSTELNYHSVSSAGVLYRLPGMDAAVRCQIDENGRPYEEPDSSDALSDYHRLMDNPAFVFDLSDWKDAEMVRMQLYCESYRNAVRLYLYDGDGWVEQSAATEIEDPSRYIDEDGKLYVQLRAGAAADASMEVSQPTILIEGRVK